MGSRSLSFLLSNPLRISLSASQAASSTRSPQLSGSRLSLRNLESSLRMSSSVYRQAACCLAIIAHAPDAGPLPVREHVRELIFHCNRIPKISVAPVPRPVVDALGGNAQSQSGK